MPFRQIFREKIDKKFWPGTSREARDQSLGWIILNYGVTLFLVKLYQRKANHCPALKHMIGTP